MWRWACFPVEMLPMRKRPKNLNVDEELARQFEATCEKRKTTQGGVLESLMLWWITADAIERDYLFEQLAAWREAGRPEFSEAATGLLREPLKAVRDLLGQLGATKAMQRKQKPRAPG